MKAGEIDLSKMLTFLPSEGKLMLGDDRMVLMRQEAFAELRKLMFEQLGEGLSRSILSRFGYRCGFGDFKEIASLNNWDTEIDTLAAGPVIHSWEGIVLATPTKIEFDRESGHFHMQGTWVNSYEADIHLKLFGKSDQAVCHTLTGYASGWTSAFFGRDLIATEPTCKARGDDMCRFDIKPPEMWGPEAEPWRNALVSTPVSIAREKEMAFEELQKKTLEAQEAGERLANIQDLILSLSTPVIQIWDQVLALPLIGVLDSQRAQQAMEVVLDQVIREKARVVIVDITGVPIVDSLVANHLAQTMAAIKLVGADGILTGISANVAQTLVKLGVDISGITTRSSIAEGLKTAIRRLGLEVRTVERAGA